MRIYERDKRWYVDFSYNGKRYRKVAGKTRREALSKLGEIQKRIETANTKGIPADAPHTFAAYAEEYLEFSKAHKKDSSLKRDVTALKPILAAFKDKKLSEISTRDVEQFQTCRSLNGQVCHCEPGYGNPETHDEQGR